MVRATLRGLQFIWDKNNQEAVTNVLMKQWKVSDRKMAAEEDGYVNGMTSVLIDAKAPEGGKPVAMRWTSSIYYSFLEQGANLGIVK